MRAAKDAIGKTALEASINNRTDEPLIRAGDHYNTSDYLWELTPLGGSFFYTIGSLTQLGGGIGSGRLHGARRARDQSFLRYSRPETRSSGACGRGSSLVWSASRTILPPMPGGECAPKLPPHALKKRAVIITPVTTCASLTNWEASSPTQRLTWQRTASWFPQRPRPVVATSIRW